MDYKQLIWQWFKNHTEITEIGIAAIMGNIACESGYIPNRLEGDVDKTQVYAKSAAYTAQVDSGTGAFSTDGKGYGLCQWTFHTRKAGLLAHCLNKGTSVGDYESQLEYLITEDEWKAIEPQIKYATDLKAASDLFCKKFENPAVCNYDDRYQAGLAAYNKFKGSYNPVTVTEKVTGNAAIVAKIEQIMKLANDVLEALNE